MTQHISGNDPSTTDRNTGAVDTESLTRSAGRGMMWQVVGAGWQTVVQLGSSVVLARVLLPRDFGMVGMAVLAQGLIGRIGNLGTSAGVIAKKDPTEEDLSTAFWISATVQGSLFLISFAVAPLVAMFFRTPELVWVMRAISLTFLFTAAGAVSGALLDKHLRFGAVKIIECSAFAFQALLAVLFAAVLGWGYWSLVLAMLAGSLASTAAGVICARWRPSFRISGQSFRYMFRYGINALGASVTDYFHNNIDYLLVGRLLGASRLGLYEFAYRIPHLLLDRVAAPIGTVLFPALSKVQDDNERLVAGYVKTARYVSLIAFPLLGGLAAVARPAVAVLWGAKWLPIVVPLQILCLSAAIRCVQAPVGSIFLCKNRPDIPFKCGLIMLVFTFVSVAGLGYALGLIGIAIGMVVATTPYLFLLWLAFRMTGARITKLLVALAPAAAGATIASVLALGSVHLVSQLGGQMWVVLAAGVAAGAGGYTLSMLLLFPDVISDLRNTAGIVLGQRWKGWAAKVF